MSLLSIGRLKIAIVVSSTLLFLVFGCFGGYGNTVAKSVEMSAKGGAEIYANYCSRCHGADGRAKTAKGKQVGAVDLTSDEWSPNEARDTRIVSKGKGSMPAFKSKLTADEITSVVRYIVRFKS